jgi:hypothetical protein
LAYKRIGPSRCSLKCLRIRPEDPERIEPISRDGRREGSKTTGRAETGAARRRAAAAPSPLRPGATPIAAYPTNNKVISVILVPSIRRWQTGLTQVGRGSAAPVFLVIPESYVTEQASGYSAAMADA